VAEVHAAAEPLKERLESSPVIGWLKDVEGRYLYINARYAEQLGATPEQVVGRSDAELEPRQAIDGPRLREGAAIEEEPVQFEYRVSAFEGRPALAVMRFPVRDSGGNVVAVCGIATAAGQAHQARSECAELIAIEAGRAPATEPSQDQEQRRRIAALHEASATAARRAHELLTALTAERESNEELRRELEAARSRLSELEQLRPADARVAEELQHTAAELRRVTDELDRERQRTGAAEAKAEQARQRAEAAEAQCKRERERADQAEHAAGGAFEVAERLRAELGAINEASPPSEPQIAAVPDVQGDDRPHWSAASQRALSATLANASEWRIGLRDVVKVLGREAGWDVVCAWVPDERGRQLRCGAMWSGEGDALAEFETRTWQKPQSLSTSVLGRAFTAREVTWLTDIGASQDDRLQTAAAEGITSAVLVPIHSGRSAIGLLELLCCHELAPDAELAAAMDGAALQLGHFWHLLELGAQPHWRLGRL
jgi:PAS domain S-box-containing protein